VEFFFGLRLKKKNKKTEVRLNFEYSISSPIKYRDLLYISNLKISSERDL
jgi:hypothetical protein